MSGGTPTGSVGRGFAVIAVAAAAAALMTGCGSSTGADPAANESALPFASPPVEGNPAEHSAVTIPEGQIDRAVESLDAIVDDVMAKSGVPGVSVAVVHDGDTVFLKGFGVRELGNPAPVDENTVFQLASLSKPVGATVVSSVVSDTDVTWDDPVTKYLPTFALADPYVTENVTLADLYSHRSGLPDHAGDLLEDLGFNQTEILTKLRLLPLEGFRSQFLYTNFGLTAAAEAVAASQGTSWARLSAERLYEPLRMTATSSDFIAYETAENKAVTHQWIDGSYQALEVRDPQAQSPAGGVSSTAADMAKWLTLQLDEGEWEGSALVAPEVLQQSREPHILSSEAATAAARPGFYALGIGSGTDDTGRVRLSHSGAFNLGASTTLTLLPAEDLGIVVLTNGAPQGARRRSPRPSWTSSKPVRSAGIGNRRSRNSWMPSSAPTRADWRTRRRRRLPARAPRWMPCPGRTRTTTTARCRWCSAGIRWSWCSGRRAWSSRSATGPEPRIPTNPAARTPSESRQ